MKTRFSFYHRIGNFIQGIVSIIESLVMILSFSYLMPNWTMRFCMWRLDTKLYDKPKTTNNE